MSVRILVRNKLIATSSVLVLLVAATNVFAANNVPAIVVKKNKVTGEYQIPNNFAGSATYISPKQIEEKQTNDINRIIREVPGVNVQEEDGYGLRPNIGMRGSRNDRSADISLMEDGILIAPSPYSSSAAYYFPNMGRVKGVEIRKGSSSIKYGPRTTSGALNLITTPIPDFTRGSFTGSLGNFDEKNFNINYGDASKNYGYVVNFDQQSSDGFKELDGGNGVDGNSNTGYDLTDFMAKLRFNTDKNAEIYQAIEFKVGVNDELSNETYVGLTLADFVNNPYRRYRGSALDNMRAEHRQYEVKHNIKPSANFDLTTTAYYHEFDRNWYKLDKVGGTSINSIFADTTTHAAKLSTLKGEAAGTLSIKANNRSYVSQGIQSVASNDLKFGDVKHNLEYGLRYHVDYEDRFQHSDTYSMSAAGLISKTATGTPGSGGNQINSTRALSAFLEDEIIVGKWTIVPGARFEHIELKRKEYSPSGGSNDSTRSGAPVTTNTSEDVIVPGIATSYKIDESLNVFGGVHKGFSPPSAGTQASAEESINYEAGLRFRGDNDLFLESVVFFNDYNNLLGTDSASSSSSGSGDQFNGGEVQAYGLELAASYQVKSKLFGEGAKFPLHATYTYNNATFQSSFTQNGIEEWGSVTKGDELPYISKHQFGFGAGVDFNKFSLNLSNKFVSAMRQSAGKGEIVKSDKIPSHFITDFVAFYEFKTDQNVFLAVDNIFDREYVASLRPSGARPGKPMTARVGLKINF